MSHQRNEWTEFSGQWTPTQWFCFYFISQSVERRADFCGLVRFILSTARPLEGPSNQKRRRLHQTVSTNFALRLVHYISGYTARPNCSGYYSKKMFSATGIGVRIFFLKSRLKVRVRATAQIPLRRLSSKLPRGESRGHKSWIWAYIGLRAGKRMR